MSQDIAEIVHPLVENGLFENAESAVRDLMVDYVLHQIEHYHSIVQTFEKKYGMNYHHFNHYLAERASKIRDNPSLQQKYMLEEEDALNWKVAYEMMVSWLGLKEKTVR